MGSSRRRQRLPHAPALQTAELNRSWLVEALRDAEAHKADLVGQLAALAKERSGLAGRLTAMEAAQVRRQRCPPPPAPPVAAAERTRESAEAHGRRQRRASRGGPRLAWLGASGRTNAAPVYCQRIAKYDQLCPQLCKSCQVLGPGDGTRHQSGMATAADPQMHFPSPEENPGFFS
jgi:hypothetical protein